MLCARSGGDAWKAMWCALVLLWLSPASVALAQAPAPAVVVQYRLLNEFAGTEKTGGRIVIKLTNRSTQALSKVTVRLADPALGRVTGSAQESIELAAGETRELEGEFLLATAAVNAPQPLDWIVIATAGTGFAQQTLVRGELLQSASMDADARTATR